MTGDESIAVTVTGQPDQLAAFVDLCKTVELCCMAGASRTIQVDVDGDGSGNLRFDFGETDVSAIQVGEDRLDGDVVRTAGIGE